MILQQPPSEATEDEEQDQLRKIVVAFVFIHSRCCWGKPRSPQSAFEFVYEGLRSLGYRGFATILRNESYAQLSCQPRSGGTSTPQFLLEISELRQEFEHDPRFRSYEVQYDSEPQQIERNVILYHFDRQERLDISDFSNDLDLKLTAATAIICARRGRTIDIKKEGSFIDWCRSVCDLMQRFPLRWLPAPIPPSPTNTQNERVQLDCMIKRLSIQAQDVRTQQLANQQHAFQLSQDMHQLDQRLMEVPQFKSRLAAPSQAGPPYIPVGLSQPQKFVVGRERAGSDCTDSD
ncbi:hypothetical protein NW762_012840 [Fusarium torreyae]|uniref:Uncharacterized protein n=1 Tax=Fusarium torreyae TaxID=1237075 RepID=A0A9W8RPA1_9HYPO|nr:hypothetical protein NW762_012840 [Fusarium torreyae]